MEKEKTNKTHVVVLKEVNGYLQNTEVPINSPIHIVEELKAMRENPNRTVWDMQGCLQEALPKTVVFHDYLFPLLYVDSYVGGIAYPGKYTYNDLKKSWDQAAKNAEDTYRDDCKRYTTSIDPTRVKQVREDAIRELRGHQKELFLQEAIRWIDACGYAKTASSLKQDASVKMYSKENVGWNLFSYTINKDVKVELRTNFGYGSASYFLLEMQYKGLKILPYSFIVKYYRARIVDILRCTRSYYPTRESWYAAFDFISEFVNNSLSDPEMFAKNYIMSEVKEMMAGLQAIVNNPRAYMDQIGGIKSEPWIINVFQMNEKDHKKMETYSEEMPVLFKVEKIMSALKFLDSLDKISKEVSDIKPYINKIYELNFGLYPEITSSISKINLKVEDLESKKVILDQKISTLNEKMAPFEKEIDEERAKQKWPNFYNISQYESSHPEYKILKSERNNLQAEEHTISVRIGDFKSFIKFLDEAIIRLDEIKKIA